MSKANKTWSPARRTAGLSEGCKSHLAFFAERHTLPRCRQDDHGRGETALNVLGDYLLTHFQVTSLSMLQIRVKTLIKAECLCIVSYIYLYIVSIAQCVHSLEVFNKKQKELIAPGPGWDRVGVF